MLIISLLMDNDEEIVRELFPNGTEDTIVNQLANLHAYKQRFGNDFGVFIYMKDVNYAISENLYIYTLAYQAQSYLMENERYKCMAKTLSIMVDNGMVDTFCFKSISETASDLGASLNREFTLNKLHEFSEPIEVKGEVAPIDEDDIF